MTKLVLAWQNPQDRMWVPIGLLEADPSQSQYQFYYLNGVRAVSQNERFKPLQPMDHLNEVYFSDKLFPLFKNRLLPKSRPEYQAYLNWLDLNSDASLVQELALTNGFKLTDSFQLYALPNQVADAYEMTFFAHGIQYLSACAQERTLQLKSEETLFVMKDFQNPYDPHALCLRTQAPAEIVGYIPKIYADDLEPFLFQRETINVSVIKVNPQAPSQLRLLCQLRTSKLNDYIPFSTSAFKPYNPSVAAT